MTHYQPYEPPTRRITPPVQAAPEHQWTPTPEAQMPPQPEPKSKVGRWPWLLLIVGLAVAASGGWAIYDRVIKKDSGIAACEALRDGDKTFTGEKTGGTKKLTEATYREMRAVFEDSRYDDIREHGTKLMDLVWQLTNMGDDPGMGALALFGPLTEHSTGLQSACADQGIIVDLKLNK